MARVIRFHRLGGPDVLEIENGEVAPPQAHEVRVAVRALGLNRAESLFRTGFYIEKPELPSGIGLEAAGSVESIGHRVTGLTPGDRIALIPPTSMKKQSLHAEVVNYPAERVVLIPENQSFEQGAATWMAYLTAYGALIEVAGIETGEHVVVTAASSSVGLAAIQILNAVGAVPIAVTRSYRKGGALLAAGAKHVVASEEDGFVEAMRNVTGGIGPRVTLDAVGGALLAPLVEAAAVGGMVVNYGAQDIRSSELGAASLLAKSLTLRGYLVHELIRDPAALETAKAFILQRLATGALRPTISRTFELDDIRSAYRFLESGEQFGKVVVTVN